MLNLFRNAIGELGNAQVAEGAFAAPQPSCADRSQINTASFQRHFGWISRFIAEGEDHLGADITPKSIRCPFQPEGGDRSAVNGKHPGARGQLCFSGR